MFELQEQSAKLASVNPRSEIHGDERVAAFDLKFEVDMPNDVLIHFHPELRTTLFKKNENPDLVDQVDEDRERLVDLRFPKLGALKWDWEGTGYSLSVEHGLGGQHSDILLGDVKIDKFTFVPKSGGTVSLHFRAIVHPLSHDVGKLCEKIQQEVLISLDPPAPTTVEELFD